MAARKANPSGFDRPIGFRHYQARIQVICEGAKTEPEYFQWLKSILRTKNLHLAIAKKADGKSSPPALIKQAEHLLRSTAYRKGDQIWLVLDADQWTDEQFIELCRWMQKSKHFHVAISNPKFEYWILLHGETDPGQVSSHQCSSLFKRMMGSSKGIDSQKLSIEGIFTAARRAKEKYQSQDMSHKPLDLIKPLNCGSTLFRFVENIQSNLKMP